MTGSLFCPRLPAHKPLPLYFLFRINWLRVAYCLVLCIGSCIPLHEDRTGSCRVIIDPRVLLTFSSILNMGSWWAVVEALSFGSWSLFERASSASVKKVCARSFHYDQRTFTKMTRSTALKFRKQLIARATRTSHVTH